MTGSAAEAEDLVQETFRRALERPPSEDAPLKPWLTRVAVNLCIDALRKRKRERYFGPWLPSPVETDTLIDGLEPGPDVRYELVESASFAFLLAMEALDPRQRAVLILRDVLGASGPEVAEMLELSAENVRVILHRARKALESYDAERAPPSEAVREETARALRSVLGALAMGDYDTVRELLAEDAHTVTDGGGKFHAAVRVVRGREAVVELYQNLMRVTSEASWAEEREYNGLPAMVVERGHPRPKEAPRMVIQVALDRAGKITAILAVLAPDKLAGVRFPSS